MISRRPNMRASTEKRPGPTPRIPTSMAKAKTSAGGESNICAAGAGKTDNGTPIMFSPTSSMANGVKRPISRRPPAIRAKAPRAEIVSVPSGCARYAPPCVNMAIARTPRISSREIPGQPPGNAEKSSCSRTSHETQLRRPSLTVQESMLGRIPGSGDRYITLFGKQRGQIDECGGTA